ncbi:regulator of microtubule dynamics protein 1-like isoform X2 [Watersipora subatra]|uniref:regulator of microtubule dynamics protein 1-like isoform X2 n=1 Tax=Watersipora subatra TaxID=2589382 RepID=UPI00355B6381
MQGDEAKHLAIAAVCGAALGAVAGAFGYATLSTPIISRRSSCSSCLENASPSHSGKYSVIGKGDEETISEQDAARLLKELNKRMESLEKAVRSKLLSRSGTNSSIAGYVTAQESSASSEDDFQDVEADSGEDVFFQSSSSIKQRTKKATDGGLLNPDAGHLTPIVPNSTEPSAEAAELSVGCSSELIHVDYAQIDQYLCSELIDDNSKAYDDLTSLHQQNPSLDSDAQFLWRFAKSAHQKNLASSDPEEKKVHAFQAKELAFKALQCEGGEELADVHKWCAITIGNIGDYVSVQEKIANGSQFKERIDAAIKLNKKDEMSFYLLGRWCYSIYMMTWVERKVARSLVSDFPSATIDEALVAFQSSEAIKPGHWIDNQLYLAKCYVEKRDYTSAMAWLDKAMTLDCKPEDKSIRDEVEKLASKYSYYRKE